MVCMYVQVHICGQLYAHIVCLCEGQRTFLSVISQDLFLRCYPLFFPMRQSLSLAWSSPSGLCWLARSPRPPPISASTVLELQADTTPPGFPHGFCVIDLGFSLCIFLAEPSSQPLLIISMLMIVEDCVYYYKKTGSFLSYFQYA